MSETKKWFSKRELAQHWGVCTKTLERLERTGRLTPTLLSTRIKRYSAKAVEEAERAGAAS